METTQSLDPSVRLMLRVRDLDDRQSFAELVETYYQRLVCHVGHKFSEAEDVAQETFLRVYRGRASYRPEAKFSTWLFTVANRVALNGLRRRGRKPTVSLPAERFLWGLGDESSRDMEQRQLAATVHEALDGLNEKQRTAVVLSRFEDKSHAEIAEAMGLTPEAVKSLLSRARENLREMLKDHA